MQEIDDDDDDELFSFLLRLMMIKMENIFGEIDVIVVNILMISR